MKRFTLGVLVLATTASSLVFTSCKKDKDDPKPKTKTELLTAKSWRVSAANVTVGTTTQDIYTNSAACSKDDFLKFNANKTLTVDEGPTKCNNSDPQTTTGAWDLTSSETKLLIQETASSTSAEVFDLVDLSDSTLKIKQTDTDNGITYTLNITYTSF